MINLYTVHSYHFCSLHLSKAGKGKESWGGCFSPLNGAQSRLHFSLMMHFAYTCPRIQLQQPGNQPEEMSGVGGE